MRLQLDDPGQKREENENVRVAFFPHAPDMLHETGSEKELMWDTRVRKPKIRFHGRKYTRTFEVGIKVKG